MNPMTQTSGVAGVGCYADGAQAIGQCKNDGQYYCVQHGEGGYCQKCLEQARASTPGGVGCVVWTLYGLAGIIVLAMLAFGGAIGNMAGSGSSGSDAAGGAMGGLVGALILGAVYLVVIGLPLFFMGRALSNGSGGVRGFIVLISYLLLLLVPVGTIAGIIILYLLNQEPTQRWFEMRKIKRNFAKAS